MRPLYQAILISANLLVSYFQCTQKYPLSAIFWHFDSLVHYQTFQTPYVLHSTDLFECFIWQNYTTRSKTDLYLSYFDLSYVFSGINDRVKRGLVVAKIAKIKEKLVFATLHCGQKQLNQFFLFLFWIFTKSVNGFSADLKRTLQSNYHREKS